MIVKVHKNHEGQVLVALCDSDILGKKFEEGNKQLDLTVDFYNGVEKTEEQVKEIIKRAYMINAVGKKSVALLINSDLVADDCVVSIGGIPHAQCVVVNE